jgi:intracellular multiplication protein IcmL
MSEQAIASKKLFAKDSLWILRIILLIQLVVLAALVAFIFMQMLQGPKPVYFPFYHGDHLTPGSPLNEPRLTEAELLNWVTEGMIVSYSFNYHNYDKISDKIEEYFDSNGAESYFQMINNNKQLQQVVSKKLILSGRPTGAPRIIKDDIINGRYAWEIELPFILKLRNQTYQSDIELKLDIWVVRFPEKSAPMGVKIVHIQPM